MRLGCHVSVSKGFVKAVEKAPQLGANAFQYFTKNPRGFRGSKPLNVAEAQLGKEKMQELDLVAVGHTPYLINLATPEDELFQLSIDALVQDMVIAEARGTYGVVVHCGKPKGQGTEYGIERMHEALRRVLEKNPTQGVKILLENTAGQGSEIGTTIPDLLAIASPFPADLVGFCLDTQHAFAAGILSKNAPQDFEGFSNHQYISRLDAIHFNDSKIPFAGKKDRHELIGQGELGLPALQAILVDPRLQSIPFFLETPVDNENQYAEEIRLCHELIASAH